MVLREPSRGGRRRRRRALRASGRGFGSLRVEVAIGSTTWRTSVFPDTKRGTYLLPVKKQVRAAEGLVEGSVCSVELTVVAGE
jgi:hypothetical protein